MGTCKSCGKVVSVIEMQNGICKECQSEDTYAKAMQRGINGAAEGFNNVLHNPKSKKTGKRFGKMALLTMFGLPFFVALYVTLSNGANGIGAFFLVFFLMLIISIPLSYGLLFIGFFKMFTNEQ